MKILIRQFLGSNHSWSIVGQNIARSLIKYGHTVDLFSTNGISYLSDDLAQNIIGYTEERSQVVNGRLPDPEYDCQISYTAMKNFPMYLSNGNKNRFGIWCYEFAGHNALPTGFAKHYKNCDLMLPPSQFAKQVFIDSGVPENNMTVIPHGIDFEQIESATPYQLKTQKSIKIGIIIGQVHRRKNLPDMLEMYGKAFTNKDDVCLIIKVQDRTPKQPFELSFPDILKTFKSKFPHHAEIEIIREYIPNIFSIYKACDIIFYATNCEGFGFPSLEALACGKINITSRYGGVLDFCNDDNSLLIDGKEFNVPPNYLYWTNKTGTKAFIPNIDNGIEKLRYAVENKERLLTKAQHSVNIIKEKYNWNKIAHDIMELTI